ncbi:MAG: hypothetical protein ACKOCW_15045, partial [Planctomycetaceae bacterium]
MQCRSDSRLVPAPAVAPRATSYTARATSYTGCRIRRWLRLAATLAVVTVAGVAAVPAMAGEADLVIPDLKEARFFDGTISGHDLLLYGSFVIAGTLGISLWLRAQIKALPAHDSMLKVADIIFTTCKTYLLKQAQFLGLLFLLIAAAMAYYFLVLNGQTLTTLLLVLLFSCQLPQRSGIRTSMVVFREIRRISS